MTPQVGIDVLGEKSGSHPDPREDVESRSPNLGAYTTKGTLQEPPIKGSTFWILPGVWWALMFWVKRDSGSHASWPR